METDGNKETNTMLKMQLLIHEEMDG